MIRRLGYVWLCGVFFLAIVEAGHIGLRRTEEASALNCARASDGTDMAIAQCYIDRNLPLPEGI